MSFFLFLTIRNEEDDYTARFKKQFPGFPAQAHIFVHLEVQKIRLRKLAFPKNQTDSIEAVMGDSIECE